jgi:L-aminopeptidase/D-esterase-like protein
MRTLQAESSLELGVPGFTLGHGTDVEGGTGVTVILCPGGVSGVAEVRGSATGTRQLDALVNPWHLGPPVHAFVLAGGSAFGLSAADEVARFLERQGHGFDTGVGRVPLVPTAILFDLGFGDSAARPTPALVRAALAGAAAGPVGIGSVGAGTGATVGKANGRDCGMKGGLGFARIVVGELAVAAVVVVNAFGDVIDPTTGSIVAGCRRDADSHELADARSVLVRPPRQEHPWEAAGNTTLAVVATNAALPRLALGQAARIAFGGFHRVLAPALSLYDGDLLAILASGEVPSHPHQLGILAQHAVEQAVLRGVRAANGLGRLPAAGDLVR